MPRHEPKRISTRSTRQPDGRSSAFRESLSHSPAEWLKIRPTLKQLYVDSDMTLRDCMLEIESVFGFSASEQMYKKRIKAWGFSKHVKAKDKDKAIAEVVQDASVAEPISTKIRHDKLVRHAKVRVKAGSLTSDHLMKIQRRPLETSLDQQLVHATADSFGIPGLRHSAADGTKQPLCASLPNPLVKFDVFLRAMQTVISKERIEWLSGQQRAPEAIFSDLQQGLIYWRSNRFAAARALFAKAARTVNEDIKTPGVAVSRITYCVSSIVWGSMRELVFWKFVQFMLNATVENLGPSSPLTIVLGHLQEEPSIEAQLVIWAAAVDGYEISTELSQSIELYYNMARRRWQWCQRSGLPDHAARYRDNALIELRQIDKLTPEMELQALQDLEVPAQDGS